MRFLRNIHVPNGLSPMFVYYPSRFKVAECLTSAASMMLYLIFLITVFYIYIYIYININKCGGRVYLGIKCSMLW